MAKLATLMYHMVAEHGSTADLRYACPADRFKAQLIHLKKKGFRFIGVEEAISGLRGASFNRDSVLVTFDDGYLDNWFAAKPILEELEIPAIFFVTAGVLGGEFEGSKMMEASHVKSLFEAGFAVGSHSVTHPMLTKLPPAELKIELSKSKCEIEELLGAEVKGFAYPHGDRNEKVVDAVEEAGYEYAFSTKSGFSSAQGSLFDIKRIEVYGYDSPARLARKIKYGANDPSSFAAMRYYFKRAIKKLSSP